MKPAPLYYTYSQESPLIRATVNNSHPNSFPAMLMTLNAINNSSLNLYDGSVVEGTAFFLLSSSTINNRTSAVTTHCHTMHSRTISFGDAMSHSTLINHCTVSDSGFLQGLQAVSQRSVISQVLQTEVVLSPIDESTTRHNMRIETVNRTAFFFKNLSSAILRLSRAGIDIPDGMSPHTIYYKYTLEKRKAEQFGYHFNKADFQHHINCKAKKRLPGLINQYHSSSFTAFNSFSALHSRSAQRAILPFIDQRR